MDIAYSDPSGVDPETFQVLFNGSDLTGRFVRMEQGATSSPLPVAGGENLLQIIVSDNVGNETVTEIHYEAPATFPPPPGQCTGLPDLAVTGVKLFPSAPFVGETVTVLGTVQNQGPVAVCGFDVKFDVAVAGFFQDYYPLGTVTVAGCLGPGQSMTVTQRGIPNFPSHIMYYRVTADPENRIEECDETNNVMEICILTLLTIPELGEPRLKWSFPPPVRAGRTRTQIPADWETSFEPSSGEPGGSTGTVTVPGGGFTWTLSPPVPYYSRTGPSGTVQVGMDTVSLTTGSRGTFVVTVHTPERYVEILTTFRSEVSSFPELVDLIDVLIVDFRQFVESKASLSEGTAGRTADRIIGGVGGGISVIRQLESGGRISSEAAGGWVSVLADLRQMVVIASSSPPASPPRLASIVLKGTTRLTNRVRQTFSTLPPPLLEELQRLLDRCPECIINEAMLANSEGDHDEAIRKLDQVIGWFNDLLSFILMVEEQGFVTSEVAAPLKSLTVGLIDLTERLKDLKDALDEAPIDSIVQAIEDLEELVGGFPAARFRPGGQKAILNKLGAIKTMVEMGNIDGAMRKVDQDLLPSLDTLVADPVVAEELAAEAEALEKLMAEVFAQIEKLAGEVEALQELVNTQPSGVFVKGGKNAILNKLEAVRKMIELGNLEQATRKIELDVLPHVDPFVKDPGFREELKRLIQNLLSVIEQGRVVAVAIDTAEPEGATVVTQGVSTVLQATCITDREVAVDCTASVAWATSDPSIAAVSLSGVLLAQQIGTVTVSASFSGVASNRLYLTVLPVPAAGAPVRRHAPALGPVRRISSVFECPGQQISGVGGFTFPGFLNFEPATGGYVSSLTPLSLNGVPYLLDQLLGVPATAFLMIRKGRVEPAFVMADNTPISGVDGETNFGAALLTIPFESTVVRATAYVPYDFNGFQEFVRFQLPQGTQVDAFIGDILVADPQGFGFSYHWGIDPEKVILSPAPPVLSAIQISAKQTTLRVGDSGRLFVECFFQEGFTVDCSPQVGWTLSQPQVGFVEQDGTFMATSPGTTSITATKDGIDSNSLTMTVLPVLTSIVISTSQSTVNHNTSTQLSAVCWYSEGLQTNCTSEVGWSSTVPFVGTVDGFGIFSALWPGTTTLFATKDGLTSNPVNLTVVPVLTSIAISAPQTTVNLYTSTQLSASCWFSDGLQTNCTTQVVWSSGAPSVGTVDVFGVFSASAVGTTVITAQKDGVTSNLLDMTVAQTVVLTSITITAGQTVLAVGQVATLAAGCLYSDMLSTDCKSQVGWNSTVPVIGTVSSNGVFAALSTGTTSISAFLDGITSNTILISVECAITCSVDAQCDDGNSSTLDICENAGTCASSCTHTPCDIACYSDMGCNDGDPFTIDSCTNPGTCAAACSYAPCTQISLADPNLEAAVRADDEYTGTATGPLCAEDVDDIRVLGAGYRGIRYLGGIQYLASLTDLWLQDNYYIADLTPLAALHLGVLVLDHNLVSDVTPLLSMASSLTFLGLVDNRITDPSPLGDLINLRYLYVAANNLGTIEFARTLKNLNFLGIHTSGISDLIPLQGLDQLSDLYAWSNRIVDLSPLKDLVGLKSLWLYSNQIVDTTPLQGLTNLTSLHLAWNNIVDIGPLAGLTNLSGLNLEGNSIFDITPLRDLTRMYELYLQYNRISDITALRYLTNLAWLVVENNQIAEIKPLVDNEGIAANDFVNLRSNPLNETALNVYIPALVARGVRVEY